MYVTVTANIWLHAIELILTQQNCYVHQKRSTNRRACSVQPTMCRPIRVKCHHNTGYRGVCDLCDCPCAILCGPVVQRTASCVQNLRAPGRKREQGSRALQSAHQVQSTMETGAYSDNFSQV